MKGWVDLVGWPIEDSLATLVVTHQLQVERRTGKVRRPETDVLPLCHATNNMRIIIISNVTNLTVTTFFEMWWEVLQQIYAQIISDNNSHKNDKHLPHISVGYRTK